MEYKMVDVTLHIDETIDDEAREKLRDDLLQTDGVMAAENNAKPNLWIIEYDPDVIQPEKFNEVTGQHGLHSQIIGM